MDHVFIENSPISICHFTDTVMKWSKYKITIYFPSSLIIFLLKHQSKSFLVFAEYKCARSVISFSSFHFVLQNFTNRWRCASNLSMIGKFMELRWWCSWNMGVLSRTFQDFSPSAATICLNRSKQLVAKISCIFSTNLTFTPDDLLEVRNSDFSGTLHPSRNPKGRNYMDWVLSY